MVVEKEIVADAASTESDDVIISIDIDKASLQDSNSWKETSEHSGTVSFCVRTEELLPDATDSASFVETALRLNASLDARFLIDGISLDNADNYRKANEETVNLKASACACDAAAKNICLEKR